jgi:Zn-finger nucleic acid-binding protein
MLRRTYSSANPVHIDECPECGGVWLDTNELASIRR